MVQQLAVSSRCAGALAEPRLRALLAQDGVREAMRTSSCCLKLLDSDGRLAAVSESARRLLAVQDPTQLVGQPWTALWPEPARPEIQALVEVGLRGGTASFEGDCPDAAGLWHRWCLAAAPVMDGDRKVYGLLVSSRHVPAEAGVGEPRPEAWHMRVHDERWMMRSDPALYAPLYTPSTGVVGVVGEGDAWGDRVEMALVQAGFPVLRMADWSQCAALERDLRLATTVSTGDPHPGIEPTGLLPSRVRLRPDWDDAALVDATVRAVVRRRHEVSFLDLLGSIDRVRRRIRHPAIQNALDNWLGLRGDAGELPDADRAVSLTQRCKNISFIASVQALGEQPVFHMEWVGSELERWLGAGLDGARIGSVDDPVVGALHQPYERALSGLPYLDWARYRFGPLGQCEFERLILPLSCDGLAVSHLVGVVNFSQPRLN